MVSTLRSGAELRCECACGEVGGERREFEVARPRRNDGTRTMVSGWVVVGRKGRTAAREGGGRVTNRMRGRKRVTDSLAILYAT